MGTGPRSCCSWDSRGRTSLGRCDPEKGLTRRTTIGSAGAEIGEEEPLTSGENVYEIATYLLTTARSCNKEPLLHRPLRLVEASSRLVTISPYPPWVNNE